MDTVEDLISQLGGPSVVSDAAAVERNTVTYWKSRDRIPPEHWEALIHLAAERQVEGVDHALMLRLHRPRKPRTPRADPTHGEAA